MQKYKSLKSIYYQNKSNLNSDAYVKAVEGRKNNELAVHTGLIMSPFGHEFRLKDKFEIFYLPSPQIYVLQEKIYTLSKIIEKKMMEIPKVAQDQIFLNNLIDELQSTNDIEGVRSSREEISQTLELLKRKSKEKSRFSGLVKLYAKFQEDKYNTIQKVEDFRTIWDELVSEEIQEDDFPDGRLFRTDGEVINYGDKVIHRGDSCEKDIIDDLKLLVREMNNDSIPSLPKCFLAHYYYEYIHPFYDGNGRTGRFIVCSYLSRKLDMMSAITFSSAIVQSKNTYYKAFTEMADPYNHGEGTAFVISMMKLLKAGQEEVIVKLDDGIRMLSNADKITNSKELSDIERNALFILCQKSIFGTYVGPITDVDLADMMNISRYKLNKALGTLEEHELIKVLVGNPKIHGLTDNVKEELFSI